MWARSPLLFPAYSVHPRLPHHHPPPPTTHPFRPRIKARPVRREAPTGSPLPQALDLVPRSHGHGHDVLRGLDERHVEQRREPTARLDLGTGPLGVVGPGLPGIETVVLLVDAPDPVFLFTARQVHERLAVEAFSTGELWQQLRGVVTGGDGDSCGRMMRRRWRCIRSALS